jgi:hypothetical protein
MRWSSLIGPIMHLMGNPTEATRLADEALAALAYSSPMGEIRWIARLLSDFRRHSDALPLWQKIASQETLTEDTKAFLDCSKHLGRHDLILETCTALRKHGVVDRELALYEVQIRQQYDIEGAVAVLNEYMQHHPEDKLVRLRLSSIGLNWNRPEIIDARPSAMPSVQEVDAHTGRAAVYIMKLGGYPNEALVYGYELLRKHFGEADAHFAFMFNLQPVDPQPAIDDHIEVTVGSAVAYVEDGDTQTNWVIIEDSPDPDATHSEYSPEHPLARALHGKKVGDRFVLAQGSVSDRTGTITSILSKYVFRYQDGMKNWQIRFPRIAAVESFNVRRISKDGKEEFDFSPVIAVVEQLSASKERLKDLYRSDPITIHMIGAARGKGTVEAALYLAQETDGSVFCCAGTADERDRALGQLDVSNTLIIEPSAIATMFLLNLEDFLRQIPVTLVLSQGTIGELNEMLLEDTLYRGEGGVLAKAAHGIAFMPITPAEREQRRQSLASRIDKLKAACKIVGCVELAKLDAKHRDVMIKAFGQGGAESVVLASKPGHLLWTDDCRLAAFGRVEYGAKSAWTQILLQWAAAKGYIPEEYFLSSTARLIGFGYSFTSPSLPALVMAAKIADWNAARWPLASAIDQLGSESIYLRDAAALAVGFMEKIYREPLIFDEQRRSIVRTLLDKLATRPGGISAIQEIKRAVRNFFGLNVLGALDVLATIEAWCKSRPIQVGV